MKHKNYFIIILTIVAIGVTACGSLPPVVVQPVTETGGQEQLPAQKTVPVTGATSDEQEAQAAPASTSASLTYPIVDTDQSYCYDDSNSISCPDQGQAFYGQDAQYTGNAPRYQDNGDGTVTDLVTGLMWQADTGEKMTYEQAAAGADSFTLAGYTDWRLPTIKELYSLIQFDGRDVMGPNSPNLIPFIDTNYFSFEYGDESAGERMIDSQWATSSIYTGSVMNGQQAMFGVNFADGRIKGYGTGPSGRGKTFFVIYVRGNTSYGINDFFDNGNGTIIDNATGLTWTQNDSGQGLDWEDALNYCESLDYAGISDWRLPNAKELHSNVDYGRSPDATNSAAIDPVFSISTITNEGGQLDYPAFWSSTTHLKDSGQADSGVYVAFGRAMGYMNGQWMDVHGAGAQRSDPKTGSVSDYPTGHGPQGDAVRVDNYVRCVTDGIGSDVQVGSTIEAMPETQPAQVPVEQSPQQGGQQNGQPPQEALNACISLEQGSACTVNTPNGTLTGSCTTVQTGQLACVPEGGPPR